MILDRPCLDPELDRRIRKKLLQCSYRNTVATFVFSVKNYPKNDKLDLKCLSRKVQQNCVISFLFHLHLVLHAFADILMWWGILFLYSGIWGWIWELNKAIVQDTPSIS
jgi:hypothetical protein